jgi:FAD/FMN-containing dehydrogenase
MIPARSRYTAYSRRSAAPNSLSIWTHNIKGLEFSDVNKFTPKHCRVPIDKHVITVGAGTQMLEVDEQASLRNLTVVGGGSGSVGIGGYLTGGGHSAISLTFGLAADQVVEMEVVTAGGKIVTANACQNEDLFWAMRGVSSSILFDDEGSLLNNYRVVAQRLAS